MPTPEALMAAIADLVSTLTELKTRHDGPGVQTLSRCQCCRAPIGWIGDADPLCDTCLIEAAIAKAIAVMKGSEV